MGSARIAPRVPRDMADSLYARILPEPLPTVIHHWAPEMLLWMWRDVYLDWILCPGVLFNFVCHNPWYHALRFGAALPTPRLDRLTEPLPKLRPGAVLHRDSFMAPGSVDGLPLVNFKAEAQWLDVPKKKRQRIKLLGTEEQKDLWGGLSQN
jgi:hypothetical protein